MKVLYISTLVSENKFNDIFVNSKIKPEQQAQKFHRLLSSGMIALGHEIKYISRPPVNNTSDQDVNKNEIEVGESHSYHYIMVKRNKIIKDLSMLTESFRLTYSWIKETNNQNRIIVVDSLNLTISIPAIILSKIYKVGTIGIVTDIPFIGFKEKKETFLKRIYSSTNNFLIKFLMKKYDYYVLLTEKMNQLINIKNNPYIIIEGIVDSNINSEELIKEETNVKTIMYAGALYEKFGISKMIESFMLLKNPNYRLEIYGNGELVDKIEKYCKIDKRIEYKGVKHNSFITKRLKDVTLLINPRPSDEEFTKYSFPSKNMEYMVSGTPLLTTLLPGMPDDHKQFVYHITDESIEGMKLAMQSVLNKSSAELEKKGYLARKYMLECKNNIIQAEKILNVSGYSQS